MTFLLKLISNILVLLIVYLSGTYLYHYLDINFFTTWREGNAWLILAAITIGYGLIVASILFSIVEKLLPN